MTTITASKPADPGPYHRANATLRSVLPHYDADVTVRTDWGLVAIVSIGFLTLLLYTAVRIWYLVDGRTAEFAEGGRVKVRLCCVCAVCCHARTRASGAG